MPINRISVVKCIATPITMFLKMRTIVLKTPRSTVFIPAIDEMAVKHLKERIVNG